MRDVAVRSRDVVLTSAITGVATGLVVAGFDKLTAGGLFEALTSLPIWVQVVAPTVGLALAFVALRWIGDRASSATADEYLRAFHDPTHELGLRPAAGRMVAAVATLGLGGALGYEGPSVYAGATIGQRLERWLPRLMASPRRNSLLVAGAAAGVAAIFKAPATGAVFALEVPYQDDLARRSLLPALVGAATGYLAFVTLLGTEPLFSVTGQPPFDLRDLGGAVVVGAVCGIGARLFAWLLRRAKTLATQLGPAVRVAVGGGVLAACTVVSWWAFSRRDPLPRGRLRRPALVVRSQPLGVVGAAPARPAGGGQRRHAGRRRRGRALRAARGGGRARRPADRRPGR